MIALGPILSDLAHALDEARYLASLLTARVELLAWHLRRRR